jgi:hypothetical protein
MKPSRKQQIVKSEDKKLLFSVTKKDFEIQTFRSGGKGGQNQNKVESGVRIIHKDSGARGESREFRDQPQNKKAAFNRLLKTKEWETWFRVRKAFALKGIEDANLEIERQVEEEMQLKNLKIETFEG